MGCDERKESPPFCIIVYGGERECWKPNATTLHDAMERHGGRNAKGWIRYIPLLLSLGMGHVASSFTLRGVYIGRGRKSQNYAKLEGEGEDNLSFKRRNNMARESTINLEERGWRPY